MLVGITLGIQYDRPCYITMEIPAQAAELPPEDYFLAMQRVGMLDRDGTVAEHLDADFQRINRRYPDDPAIALAMCTLRRKIDDIAAPSMSVEDVIGFYPDHGRPPVAVFKCESRGWTKVIPADAV